MEYNSLNKGTELSAGRGHDEVPSHFALCLWKYGNVVHNIQGSLTARQVRRSHTYA